MCNALEFTCANRATRRIRLRHRVAGLAAGLTLRCDDKLFGERKNNDKRENNYAFPCRRCHAMGPEYADEALRLFQLSINMWLSRSPRPPWPPWPPMPRSADIPVHSATKHNRFLGRKSSVKQIANATVAGWSPAIISHLQRAVARAAKNV